MQKKITQMVLLALCLRFSAIAFAATIELKSGQEIEGDIIEQTDSYIKIDFLGIALTYFLEEIKRIKKENKIDHVPAEANIPDKQTVVFEGEEISPTNLQERAALISQINKAYYNLPRQGLRELRCEVACNILNQAKENMRNAKYSLTDQEIKVLDSMKFYFIIDQAAQFSFDSTPYTSAGNAQFDNDIKAIVSYVDRTLFHFYEVWMEYCIVPQFEENDVISTIDKLPNGYNISYKVKEPNIGKKMSIDANFCISQKTIAYQGKVINKILPYFANSNHGLLLKGYELDLENGFTKYIVAIEYQEVEGLQMPKRVVIQYIQSGVTLNVEFKFFNFQVTRRESVSRFNNKLKRLSSSGSSINLCFRFS